MKKTEQKTELCEMRCVCGSLLARIGENAIELKCRRCKKLYSIPFSTEERNRFLQATQKGTLEHLWQEVRG